jgi:hypothetical protein
MKPFRGRLHNAVRVPFQRGFYYLGTLEGGKPGTLRRTSFVVWEQPHHTNQYFEIETLNSRYLIISLASNTKDDRSHMGTQNPRGHFSE